MAPDPSTPKIGRWIARLVIMLIGLAVSAVGVKGALDGDVVGVGVALLGLIVAVVGATGRWSAFWELFQP